MKPKVSSRKGRKIRVEINETENKITRMNKTKSWFFEKIKSKVLFHGFRFFLFLEEDNYCYNPLS